MFFFIFIKMNSISVMELLSIRMTFAISQSCMITEGHRLAPAPLYLAK